MMVDEIMDFPLHMCRLDQSLLESRQHLCTAIILWREASIVI